MEEKIRAISAATIARNMAFHASRLSLARGKRRKISLVTAVFAFVRHRAVLVLVAHSEKSNAAGLPWKSE